MAQTPEGRVKDKVKEILKKYKVYWHMPVQNGMGSPTLDFVCCVRGLYFVVETKAPGKKATPRQELTMHQIQQAGGRAFVVDGDTTTLEQWLQEIAE